MVAQWGGSVLKATELGTEKVGNEGLGMWVSW